MEEVGEGVRYEQHGHEHSQSSEGCKQGSRRPKDGVSKLQGRLLPQGPDSLEDGDPLSHKSPFQGNG
jgi:hypothetical protein